MLDEHLAGTPLRVGALWRTGAPKSSSQLGQEHNVTLFHWQGVGYGSVSGGGGFDQWDGFLNVSGGRSVPHAPGGPGRGDRQPLGPQGREGQGTDRGEGMRTRLPATLFAGVQPYRASLLQAQELPQDGVRS